MDTMQVDSIEHPLIAQGTDELRQLLEALLQKSSLDPAFAATPHYVRYQIGSQKSFIKVDMSEKPYLFWYCDLMGRPVTRSVQYTIADFLWEKCGVREEHMQELTQEK